MNVKITGFVLACFVLILAGCTSPRVKDSQPPDQLDSLDVNRINEIFRVQSEVGDLAWPGFGKAKFQFILVGRSQQWAINIDPLPAYYKPIALAAGLSKEVTSLAVTDVYRDEFGEKKASAPEILYNSYSKEMTGLHFKHSIYLVKTLDEYHRIGDDQAAEEWIHISLHELFHTFQDQYVDYSDAFLKEMDIHIKQKLRGDAEHVALLRPELALLAKAACSDSKAEIEKSLKAAFKLRKKRWAFIEKKYKVKPDQWERYDAWAEGTAHYAEHMIMACVSKYETQTLLRSDPFFRQYASYQGEGVTRWCAEIGDVAKKSYWYSLGFAYSLILDKLSPDWKSKSFDKKLFFDEKFKKLGLL